MGANNVSQQIKGTAITMVNSIGFGITILSILNNGGIVPPLFKHRSALWYPDYQEYSTFLTIFDIFLPENLESNIGVP